MWGQGKIAVHLVSPNIPAGRFLSGKQLHAGQVARQLNDFVTGHVRLFAVFLHRGNNKLMDTGAAALGLASFGKQADFRIASRPVAQPINPVGPLLAVPPLDRDLRECGPQEQQTVLFRQRFHRQGAQLVNAHGGIVMFRRTCFLALIPPRRIGVNDVVSFLLYFLDGW